MSKEDAMIPPDFATLVLETSRLELEPIDENHTHELFELFSDNRLHSYVAFEAPTLEEQRARTARWVRRISPDGNEVWLNWVARDKVSRRVVGHFQSSFRSNQIASIGYVLSYESWGKGLAVEALSAILSLLRGTFCIREVQAFIDTRNTASIRVASKLGMVLSDTINEASFFKGHKSDEHLFSLKF